MPQTSFSCRDKILGGYYADPETNCQMFHICVKIAGVGVSWSITKTTWSGLLCGEKNEIVSTRILSSAEAAS